MPDTGDEVQVRERKLTRKIRRTNEIAYLHQLLDTYGGREFVWRLFGQCGLYQASFRGEDTHQSAFQEGKRGIGLWALDEVLTAHPEAYTMMRDEAVSRDTLTKERKNGGE